MTYEDIKLHLERQPFVPFTIRMDDGDLIGVRSMEYVYLHPKKTFLFVARDGESLPIDRFLDLAHISQLSTEDGFDIARRSK